MKIHVVGAKLFHADRRTDMTKLVVVFFAILQICVNVLHEQNAHLCDGYQQDSFHKSQRTNGF